MGSALPMIPVILLPRLFLIEFLMGFQSMCFLLSDLSEGDPSLMPVLEIKMPALHFRENVANWVTWKNYATHLMMSPAGIYANKNEKINNSDPYPNPNP